MNYYSIKIVASEDVLKRLDEILKDCKSAKVTMCDPIDVPVLNDKYTEWIEDNAEMLSVMPVSEAYNLFVRSTGAQTRQRLFAERVCELLHVERKTVRIGDKIVWCFQPRNGSR